MAPSLYELGSVSLESFLAFYATEVVGFSVVCDLEFGCVFVQNYAANRVCGHYLILNLV